MRVVFRVLELHNVLDHVGSHHRLEVLGVLLVVVFYLAPLLHALVVAPYHALELDLVSHCDGMDFLELGDLGDHHVEESELVGDLLRKRSSPKIADLSGSLSGIVLMKRMRKTGVARSCCGVLPFVW